MQPAVATLLRKTVGPSVGSPEARIALSWDRVVGEIAEGATPAQIRGQTLVVHVDHPARLARVQFGASAIIGALREALPDIAIRRIRAIVSADASPPRTPHPVDRDAGAPAQQTDPPVVSPHTNDPAIPDRRPPEGALTSKEALLERISRIAESAPSS